MIEIAKTLLKAPVHVYRWTLKPLMGMECRHLPTCSEYALNAIDTNGAWRGFWLTLSRVLRCHPWGSSGYDPAPDISAMSHPFAPWLYGRWTGRHIKPVAAGTGFQDAHEQTEAGETSPGDLRACKDCGHDHKR
ncbi:MAG: membrane protein insertion efficiency factor YidD [Hyphomicrobiaceae bacterium]